MDKKTANLERVRQLRIEATRELGSRLNKKLIAIPEPIWAMAVKKNEVHTALKSNNPDMALDDLVDYLLELYTVVEQCSTARRAEPTATSQENPPEIIQEESTTTNPELSVGEVQRMKAISAFFGKLAAAQRGVIRFRNEVLQGRLLTVDKSSTFLASPALRYLTRLDFYLQDIPYVDHHASYSRDETDDNDDFRMRGRLVIHSKGIYMDLDMPEDELIEWEWSLPGTSLQRLHYRVGSVADELIKISQDVANTLSWREGEALQFILAGIVPNIEPIRARTSLRRGVTGGHQHCQGWITMEIQPWTSPETVQKTYRNLQQQMIGGVFRTLNSERKLAVFQFITEQMIISTKQTDYGDSTVTLPRGSELLARWKTLHPEETLDQVSNLWRDYSAAKRTLINPTYKFPRLFANRLKKPLH